MGHTAHSSEDTVWRKSGPGLERIKQNSVLGRSQKRTNRRTDDLSRHGRVTPKDRGRILQHASVTFLSRVRSLCPRVREEPPSTHPVLLSCGLAVTAIVNWISMTPQLMSLLTGATPLGNALPVISSRWAKSALMMPAGCCENHWGPFLRLSP